MMSETKQGTVKWFSAEKGYGFVTDTEGVDYFVHFSEIRMDGFRKLSSGQMVVFAAGEDERGRTLARDVVPAGPETEGLGGY